LIDEGASVSRENAYLAKCERRGGEIAKCWESFYSSRRRTICKEGNECAVITREDQIVVERGWRSDRPEALICARMPRDENVDCASVVGNTLLIGGGSRVIEMDVERISGEQWQKLKQFSGKRGNNADEEEEEDEEDDRMDEEEDDDYDDDEEDDDYDYEYDEEDSNQNSVNLEAIVCEKELFDRQHCREILPYNKNPFCSLLVLENTSVCIWDRREEGLTLFSNFKPTLHSAVCGAISCDDQYLGMGLRSTCRLYDCRTQGFVSTKGEARNLEFFGREMLVALCDNGVRGLPTISSSDNVVYTWGDSRSEFRPNFTKKGFHGAGNSLALFRDQILFNTFSGSTINYFHNKKHLYN
jgi:hypothetical protein